MNSNDHQPNMQSANRFGQLKSFAENALHKVAAPEFWRITLTLISSVTTLLGLMLLYDTFGGADQGSETNNWLRYAVPFGVAGALHSMIFWALGRWSATRRLRNLLVALALQAVAAAGSYGTHWVQMQGKGETIAAYEQSVNAIDRGVRSFVQSYQVMGSATNALAAHSEKQARIEAASGTSCASQAKAGEGPRYALRMSDRDTYSAFNQDIATRQKQLEELTDKLAKTGVSSASEAISHLDELRRIVNQAKVFESDPLLPRLKQTAQQRLSLGEGAIEIPPAKRVPGGATTFTCPDTMLKQNLAAVIDAIAALKPLPEVSVPIATDPRVGFGIALGRLTNTLMGASVLPLNRAVLKAQRSGQLAGAAPSAEGMRRQDIIPLLTAIAIEICLTLLFKIRGGSLPDHPGMDELRQLAARRKSRIFDEIWIALGGGIERGAVRDALARHTKFEGNKAFVIVPVYSEAPEARNLHGLMMILDGIGMATCIYGGRFMRRLLTVSWPEHLRRAATVYGVIRVYRMSKIDYLAFVLDAINGSQDGSGSGGTKTTAADRDATPTDPTKPPAIEFRRAA